MNKKLSAILDIFWLRAIIAVLIGLPILGVAWLIDYLDLGAYLFIVIGAFCAGWAVLGFWDNA